MVSSYSSKSLRWQNQNLCHGKRVLVTIERDSVYPSMWRVRRPDGSLSDMVNLTRAKDAAMSAALADQRSRLNETAS